jgi:hypothetical protein
MRNKALIDYLRKMMERYPGLSARKMSIDAELANNAVTAILTGKTNPTPYTIEKLVSKWGTPEDYMTLMRLAGHLPPESDNDDLDIAADELQGINLIREAKGKKKLTAAHFRPVHQPTTDDLLAEVRARLAAIRARRPDIPADLIELLEKARDRGVKEEWLRSLVQRVLVTTPGSQEEDEAIDDLCIKLNQVIVFKLTPHQEAVARIMEYLYKLEEKGDKERLVWTLKQLGLTDEEEINVRLLRTGTAESQTQT